MWNDPDVAIQWPVEQPILSVKDQQGLSLQELV
ncbi:dTDP-4-dehydrorhamnose 3,5-epimerase family protein [Pantoea ananatis]|nr:dTDP-4-dehydrorhamnose 3,5-epimerase family protein [Pantoea ananatis]